MSDEYKTTRVWKTCVNTKDIISLPEHAELSPTQPPLNADRFVKNAKNETCNAVFAASVVNMVARQLCNKITWVAVVVVDWSSW